MLKQCLEIKAKGCCRRVFLVIIVIQLMFLGINMFLSPSQTHFNPRCARAKMSLSWAKNIFMPANMNSIVIIKYPAFNREIM